MFRILCPIDFQVQVTTTRNHTTSTLRFVILSAWLLINLLCGLKFILDFESKYGAPVSIHDLQICDNNVCVLIFIPLYFILKLQGQIINFDTYKRLLCVIIQKQSMGKIINLITFLLICFVIFSWEHEISLFRFTELAVHVRNHYFYKLHIKKRKL